MTNRNAPLSVKLDVLDRCAVSSLLYASETWGNNFHDVEFIYKSGVRIALDIRHNINNEIIYVESNTFPLECRIKKLQMKFWLYLREYTLMYPEAAISKVLRVGEANRIGFVKHYTSLINLYANPKVCQEQLQISYKSKWSNTLRFKAESDADSRLGTYLRINPEMKSWIPKPQSILEVERKLVTRFRTGSHSLNIEIGRYKV